MDYAAAMEACAAYVAVKAPPSARRLRDAFAVRVAARLVEHHVELEPVERLQLAALAEPRGQIVDQPVCAGLALGVPGAVLREVVVPQQVVGYAPQPFRHVRGRASLAGLERQRPRAVAAALHEARVRGLTGQTENCTHTVVLVYI